MRQETSDAHKLTMQTIARDKELSKEEAQSLKSQLESLSTFNCVNIYFKTFSFFFF